MAYENISKESNFFQSAMGDYGFRFLESAESSSDGFRAIQALEASEITTTTQVGDALTNVALAEGSVIYGKFDTVSCITGKVLAYKAV